MSDSDYDNVIILNQPKRKPVEKRYYAVTWRVSVEATNSIQAAKLARDIQLDPESASVLFDVHPEGHQDQQELVDLFDHPSR
jgi:hypothetical protein